MKPKRFKLLRGTFDTIGLTGSSFLEAGHVFAPYIPMNGRYGVVEDQGFYFNFNNEPPIRISNGENPLTINLSTNNDANISFTDGTNTFRLYYNG